VGLSVFSKEVLKNKQISLFICGRTFEIIQHNSIMLEHFTFILAFSKHIFGYGLSPKQKGAIVVLIRNLVGNPSVLAIGSGYKDTLMMQNADVSIEIKRKVNKKLNINVFSNSGDIIVDHLKQVRSLMLQVGSNLFQHSIDSIFFLCHQQLVITTCIFYYNYYNMQSGASLVDSFYLLFYSSYTVCTLSLIGSSQDRTTNLLHSKFPSLYLNG